MKRGRFIGLNEADRRQMTIPDQPQVKKIKSHTSITTRVKALSVRNGMGSDEA
jgi:hypothetical protein